jgi:hypothetical protein
LPVSLCVGAHDVGVNAPEAAADNRLRLMAVTGETAVYPWSGPGWAVSLAVVPDVVWRTSRACSAARVMLSLMKSRKRAMFSRRVAAGV